MAEAANQIPLHLPDVDSGHFDVESIRNDFPILRQKMQGKQLVYLDNAATAQKPQSVIDAVSHYYRSSNSNIHRSVYQLGETATKAYEDVRKTVKQLLNANSTKEIIFVSGTTEGINLVATSYGGTQVGEGDEIIISAMEHHSNIVPWQLLCQGKGATLKIIPMNDDGELLIDEYENLLGERTKIVSLVHISNSLGTINPVKQLIALAHERGIPVLIDGAQALPHIKVDVKDLDCDFYAFSGHKVFGPTGVGVLYAKETLLEKMTPYQSGGDMIRSVSFEKTTFNDLPHRFEAGTPNIAGVVGLGKALDYVTSIGYENIEAHDNELMEYGTDALSTIKSLRLIGTARNKTGVVSFVLDGVHPHDVGTVLDQEGIAVRTGHHCTQPVMDRYGIPATTRASFAPYNSTDEIDALVKGIHKVVGMFC